MKNLENTVSNKPLVSVIMPTYKRNDFLVRAITTLLEQDYENLEIIVIDDNDPVSEYRRENRNKFENELIDSKIRYIENVKNLGGALARNEGIKVAKGKYITFLDDDDVYISDKISKQVEFMELHNFDMTFMDLIIRDINENVIDIREFDQIRSFDYKNLMSYHLQHHITGTPTFMYKRKFINQIGGFSQIRMGQEFLLMLKTIQAKGNIGYLPEKKVVAYAHSDERISLGNNKIQGEIELLDLKKKYFNELNRSQIKYVKFRHHAVILFTYYKQKRYGMSLKHALLGFYQSPIASFLELKNMLSKKNKLKNLI